METRTHSVRDQVVVSVLLALMVTSCPLAASSSGNRKPDESFAFIHASVISMVQEGVLPNRTVIVHNGSISEIGPTESTIVPDGTVLIDATNQYLIPAYCDMHVHLLNEAWNMFQPPEAPSQATELDLDSFLFLYLAKGVTTVQVLSATTDDLDLRERISQGEVLGPRLVLARMIDGPDKAWPPPLSTWVASPEAARAAVLEAYEAGYDAMKAYSFLDRASYDAIVAATQETDMDLIGHIPLDLSLEYVVNAGQKLIVHSEEVMKHAGGDFSREMIEHLATTLADSDTWIIPTLVTSRNVLALFDDVEGQLSRSEVSYFQHPIQQGAWSFIIQNLYMPIASEQRQSIREGFEQFQLSFTKTLHDRGVKLLAGTDTGVPVLVPGFALHRELEELVRVGLTPYEALKTSTTHPIEYLGELDEAGTVEVGKRADLVLLKDNPLVDIRHSDAIAGVMLGGQWLAEEEIEEGLSSLRDPRSSLSSPIP